MSQVSLANIQWGPTLWLNFLRSLAAGIVWFAVRLVLQDPFGEAASMLLLPGVYLVILLPLGLFAILLTQAGVPFASLLSLMAAIAIIPGDPVLFLMNLIVPTLIPVRHYNPVNLKLVLLVI